MPLAATCAADAQSLAYNGLDDRAAPSLAQRGKAPGTPRRLYSAHGTVAVDEQQHRRAYWCSPQHLEYRLQLGDIVVAPWRQAPSYGLAAVPGAPRRRWRIDSVALASGLVAAVCRPRVREVVPVMQRQQQPQHLTRARCAQVPHLALLHGNGDHVRRAAASVELDGAVPRKQP